jgi:VanZ family protein
MARSTNFLLGTGDADRLPAGDFHKGRRALVALALAYLAFVIYGSLVPLHFHSRPLAEAWRYFRQIPYLNLGIGSRADWVANILLFIPLAFLWLGVLWHRRSLLLRAAASLLVLGAGVGLSVGIEFTQLFFPPRTVSLNDILAETIGAGIGVAAWWLAGPAVFAWFARWAQENSPSGLAERLLYLYLFVLFAYNLLPLDLTLSPVEIYHKWQAGRLILVPFGFAFANPAEAWYGLATDALIWAPVGFLWRLRGKHSALAVWLLAVAAAALLEFLQLFVYTRVSDVTDILTAALGGAAGIWLAGLRQSGETSGEPRPRAPLGIPEAAIWSGAALLWLGVMAAVFWYPFDFHFERGFIRERLLALNKVPFEIYYFGTEYRAATEVLHKAGFFLPLGALLGLAKSRIGGYMRRRAFGFGAVTAIVLAACGIEFGKVLLPGKHPDLTNVILEISGGALGYWLLAKARQLRWKTAPIRRGTLTGGRPATGIAVGIGLLAALAWFATHSSLMPYNVRELLVGERPLLSVLLLSGFVYWAAGFPVWVAGRLANGNSAVWAYPGLVLLHAVAAWTLLRLGVPLESIHDIVGSPVLGWPWEWEMIGRFAALFSVVSLLLTAGALAAGTINGHGGGRAWPVWLAAAAAMLPAAHWVVVTQAATDNLTELMAGGGGWVPSLLLAVSLAGTALAGSLLALLLAGSRRRWAVSAIWPVAWLPLSYLVVSHGTEGTIVKYGKVFSALQFLLSTDRTHYAGGAELLVRYAFFYLGAVGAIALIQLPLWKGHLAAESLSSAAGGGRPDRVQSGSDKATSQAP